MNVEYQTVSLNTSNNESKDAVVPKLLREPSQEPRRPSPLRKFLSDFLNWGNIFQSFIGTSILSLPFYMMRVGSQGRSRGLLPGLHPRPRRHRLFDAPDPPARRRHQLPRIRVRKTGGEAGRAAFRAVRGGATLRVPGERVHRGDPLFRLPHQSTSSRTSSAAPLNSTASAPPKAPTPPSPSSPPSSWPSSRPPRPSRGCPACATCSCC